jgi:TonB family protein
MKVAESRIASTAVSFTLHTAGLISLVLVSRPAVPVVEHEEPQFRVTPLVAPLMFTPRKPSPTAVPAATLSSPPVVEPAAGRFDESTKPEASARIHGASDSVVTGALPGPPDLPIPISGQTGKIIVGEFGGGGNAVAAAPAPLGTVRPGFSGPGSGSENGFEGGEPPRMLSAPSARYTDEALRLGIKGSVVLKVRLTASGAIRVLGIVHSLGHGLDEAAMVAANAMQFVPARSTSGTTIDSIAIVTVVFDMS